MNKLIVFDLDGTLAESKASLDAEMASLLGTLLTIVKVAVISGGDWPQFQKQLLLGLRQDDTMKNLYLLPTCGTKFYQYTSIWSKLYSEDFTSDERATIEDALRRALATGAFQVDRVWGETIEDRGSQITFSALGQQAPLEEKKKWDPDFSKRKNLQRCLLRLIPEYSVRLGGATSVDITRPGIDKAYGIKKLHETLHIEIDEMIFIGDALFPGGNDYPVKQAGVVSIRVRDPNESKRVIEARHRNAPCLQGCSAVSLFQLRRLGTLMEPQPGNPLEVEGVLNPAAARGPDGHLYLFPRLVAKGNYSRIGISRVRFDGLGEPAGVERLGIALEPTEDYERRSDGSGGCEDARVTFVEPLKCYLMTYTALSSIGPRIALAMSMDLLQWTRIGLAIFEPYDGIDFVHVDNKDASIFPVAVPNHCGKMQLALLHRPLFPGTRPEEMVCKSENRTLDRNRESIWVSYCPMSMDMQRADPLGSFNSHRRLAAPIAPWEKLKIGGGTPPIFTRHGWLILYHGVSRVAGAEGDAGRLSYSAGAMVLARQDPSEILYRSLDPVLSPQLLEERVGIISNVVFPTGIDRRDDLGSVDRFDVYYGMADNRIGVARLDVPQHLPSADRPT